MTVADSLQHAGFTHLCPIGIERDSTGIPIEDFPQNRYENHGHVRLNTHGKGPFCRLTLQITLPDGPGVYVITVDDSVVYIGECENLRRMFGSVGFGVIQPSSCFVGGQSTNCKVNSRILESTLKNAIPVLWFLSEGTINRKLVKENLVSNFRPAWNDRG